MRQIDAAPVYRSGTPDTVTLAIRLLTTPVIVSHDHVASEVFIAQYAIDTSGVFPVLL
jgi:hypothetical protein